ncbi:hypothetical protein [Haliscomenobacter hydrossis]|uniref:Uncharacterized protein n=1 Tax=Haliscomenobacter hydrossis (strain ATCC 27775 / DSM 1100 / LMG 10767 / O) TaxID=760192 RepID=F4KZF8_HALH1|nr:hypothetical protein [Haliscomenobacter hydrossis]AEE49428.1 hypothetical protein Halhy_1536 [Haliscomenobacter hydrossis DSM 1100]
MEPLNLNNTTETHPLFPSGEWEGFYTYADGRQAQQHKMDFTLFFENNVVSGGGSDDIGSFVWKGSYDTKGLWCKMTKHYVTHTVAYDGNVDENGIWGNWNIRVQLSGGFHIWPKKKEESTRAEEVDVLVLDNIVKVPSTVTV